MSEHTKEPWGVVYDGPSNPIITSDRGNIAHIVNCYDVEEVEPNAQRIVDCVNALSQIKDVPGFMETIQKAVEVFKECHNGEYAGTDSDYVLEIWESVDSIVDLFPKPPTEDKEVGS